MNLAGIINKVGKADRAQNQTPVDVIEFAESEWGLAKPDSQTGQRFRLFPVQRIILKAHYGLKLDDNPYGVSLDDPIPLDHPAYDQIADLDPGSQDYGYYKNRIKVTDWRRENLQYMTEAGYLRYIHSQGRSNIAEVDHERRELVLSIGRRSGKTLLASVISAYETYKLLLKGNPHGYYGVSTSNPIHIVSVATDKEQAGLLYKEVSGHYQACDFFMPFMAHSTQSFASFQTPRDIEKYGKYSENPAAKASIIVTFKSCIAKSVRGMGMIVAILDEMAHFTDEGQSSADEVYNAIRPATAAYSAKNPSDSRQAIGPVESRIVAISSPLGRQGMFYKLFQIGMKGGRASENLLCIQAPTWEVNPTIPASEFEINYQKDATVFFTEFGGEFTDRTRGWIERAEDLLACVQPNRRPANAIPAGRPHFIGIDFALKKDGTAVAIGHLEKSDKGPIIVLDLVDQIKVGVGKYRDHDRLDFDDVADWIASLAKRFYFSHGIFDQWAGIPFEQALAKRGLHQLKTVHFTDVLNSDTYRNFKDMMWAKQVALYDYPIPEGKEHCEYIEELLELQATQKTKNIVVVEAPNLEGKHDDRSDALVRMVWLASQNMTKAKMISGVHTGTFAAPRGGVSSQGDYARAMNRARKMGSSPDRQQSRFVRGRTVGR